MRGCPFSSRQCHLLPNLCFQVWGRSPWSRRGSNGLHAWLCGLAWSTEGCQAPIPGTFYWVHGLYQSLSYNSLGRRCSWPHCLQVRKPRPREAPHTAGLRLSQAWLQSSRQGLRPPWVSHVLPAHFTGLAFWGPSSPGSELPHLHTQGSSFSNVQTSIGRAWHPRLLAKEISQCTSASQARLWSLGWLSFFSFTTNRRELKALTAKIHGTVSWNPAPGPPAPGLAQRP